MIKEQIIEKWKEAYKNKDEILKSSFAMVKAKMFCRISKEGKKI